jgi:hypothetical protein
MNLFLSPLDFFVLIIYLIGLFFIGFYLNKKTKSNQDIFFVQCQCRPYDAGGFFKHRVFPGSCRK